MVVSSSTSSASSVSSLSSISFSEDPPKPSSASSLKFLCSYGGLILPRFPDSRLRYTGGETRVLSVDRSVSFADLMDKMSDLCGWGLHVSIRCQIPTEDLDALVSITSDEDLANLIEEYDLANRDRASPRKIRAFLFPPTSPPSSKGKSPSSSGSEPHRLPSPPSSHRHRHRHHRHVCAGTSSSSAHGHPHRVHLVHSGGHW